MMKKLLQPDFALALTLLLACVFLPQEVFASGGITEFSSPLEKVVNTITGPVGKWISIIAFCITGLMLIFQRQEMTEGVKMLCGVVFAISFIAFAGSIVPSMFNFSGAIA